MEAYAAYFSPRWVARAVPALLCSALVIARGCKGGVWLNQGAASTHQL